MLYPALKRLDSTALFVIQSAMDGFVETARRQIGLKANVDGLRAILIKPRIQFFQFLRRERSYMARSISWTVFKSLRRLA